jgi:DNA polymerase I-like protein with 3'-5' exonuclease and polymerase domains
LTFDLEYLFDYGLEPSGIYMDTMLSHSLLYPVFPKSLAFLCAMYTEMPYYKDEGKVSNPKIDLTTLHEYNNKDTIATLWCAQEIAKQLKQRGLWDLHLFVTQEISIALEMQRNRLPVDISKRDELKAMVTAAQVNLDQNWIMPRLGGATRPNVNSPKQVAEFLYGPTGLKLKAKTWQGKVVADEGALTELRAKYPDKPELNWILEERHLRKLNSSYLDIELEPDGTLGGGWCCNGTETGRWTSGKGPRGRGLNLQTFPKAIRWMVVPPIREGSNA